MRQLPRQCWHLPGTAVGKFLDHIIERDSPVLKTAPNWNQRVAFDKTESLSSKCLRRRLNQRNTEEL